jgi:hypothetical protein
MDEPRALLLQATYALRARRRFRLPEGYLRGLFEGPSGGAPPRLAGELQRAAADLERRLAAGEAREVWQDQLAAALMAAAERRFVLDPKSSTLELLEPPARDRFLGFAWQADDFPGEPRGPNEQRAAEMFAALGALRPERRPNQGAAAVLVAAEVGPAIEQRIVAALLTVPGTGGLRLHREAADAFARMRAAAAGAGVTLAAASAYRMPARAPESAERPQNPTAVARFSSHSLGLAVDLNMSHGDLRFTETATRPFQNLVDMYRSPVHKWMLFRGEEFGFYPYRAEPWHWEYNPPEFRERFRAAALAPSPPPQPVRVAVPAGPVAELEEAAASASRPPPPPPLRPIRPPISIRSSVGRGGRNLAADVRAVQERLIELRELDTADAAAERPGDDVVSAPEASLPRTIAAIERFQRERGGEATGMVEGTGGTRLDLDRAIPRPGAADYAQVTRQRDTIAQHLTRGLAIQGPVGATAAGNQADDVRAVQRRLVALGKLPAAHAESPPAGASSVPQAALAATIGAIRAFQPAARFWVARGRISGAITNGVVAPGDGTAALLDRIATYDMTSGDARLSFSDHVVSPETRDPAGISYAGTAAPARLPASEYQAAGLDGAQAAALRQVSSSEGSFDAVNTYDRAVVSVGFIQFAGGGRGLGPYLALLKLRQPVKFRDLLQRYGLDVEVGMGRAGQIEWTRVLVLDPAASRVLGAGDAEAVIRDDKRLTAALILSGRDRDVQRAQLEAAVRDYVRPALGARITWGHSGARLGDLLRSRKGIAAVLDRAIQEGPPGAQRRFERVVRAVNAASSRQAAGAPPRPLSVTDLQVREGDVLAALERDLQSAANAGAALSRARDALGTLAAAARASGATVAAVLARPELADARRALTDTRAELEGVINLTPPGRDSVDATLATMKSALSAEETTLALQPTPPSPSELGDLLDRTRATLRVIAGPLAPAPVFLHRIQIIRRSTLDASLTESDEVPKVPRRFVRSSLIGQAGDYMASANELR